MSWVVKICIFYFLNLETISSPLRFDASTKGKKSLKFFSWCFCESIIAVENFTGERADFLSLLREMLNVKGLTLIQALCSRCCPLWSAMLSMVSGCHVQYTLSLIPYCCWIWHVTVAHERMMEPAKCCHVDCDRHSQLLIRNRYDTVLRWKKNRINFRTLSGWWKHFNLKYTKEWNPCQRMSVTTQSTLTKMWISLWIID